MWVLIYFPKRKKSSVVRDTLVLPKRSGKKPNPGDEVLVKWNSSQHRAKILRYSSIKAYLEKLHVDVKTGEIVTPQVKSAEGEGQNIVERQHILKTTRESDQSMAYTQKKHDELLQEMMDGYLQASEEEEALLDDTHEGSNFTQTQNEETNTQVKKENEIKRRRMSDDLKTQDPVWKRIKIEPDSEGITREQFCPLNGVFSNLTVTPEIVAAFECVTNYLRAHLQAQIVPPNPQVLSHNTETMDIPISAWRLPGVEKVQLGSSGVWVDSGQLKILTASWQKNPNELARRLFKWLVGEPTLARTSALGRGAKRKQALDPFLRTAVADYVENVTGRRIKINRVVNLMCGKLAAKYNVASTKSGERKSAPNPKNSTKTLGKNPRETVAHKKKTKNRNSN